VRSNCAWAITLEQRALALFGRLHGGELRLGAVKRRLGGSNRDLLDRGVDGGERLALGDRIADIDVAGDQAPEYLEAEHNGIAGLDAPGEWSDGLRSTSSRHD
jgi:hypothetical protein